MSSIDHATENPHAASGEFTPAERTQSRRLGWVLALIAGFFFVELGGAIASHSVVLQADALHLLMDVLAIAMSLVAMRLAVRRPTERFTFGMRRAEPVAAIFNGLLVLVATFEIVSESLGQLVKRTVEPDAGPMLWVASAALVVNGLSAWLLHGALHHGHAHGGGHDHGHDHDHDHAHHDHDHDSHDHAHEHDDHEQRAAGHSLNVRGAWLHLLGDTLCSLAALIAALVLKLGGPSIVDPIASLLVAVVLLLGAFGLLRDAIVVLAEAAPKHLPVARVRTMLLAFPGVLEVHDLHVWTLGAGHDAITAHVRADLRADSGIGNRVSEALRAKFGVEYVTVQVEDIDRAYR